MKITGNSNIQNVLNNYQKSIKKSEQVNQSSYQNDKVEISKEARDFQVAMNAINHVPEIREDKVNEVKNQIEAGTYNPSSKDVASKILASIIEIE